MFGQGANWSGRNSQDRNFRHEQYSCKSSFDLPFPSNKLFLLARGPIGGSAKILQCFDRTEDEGVVKVEVVARYSHASDLDFINVCNVTREGDENGIGIFASQLPNHVTISLEVTMYLPKASPGRASLHVKNLETDLPLFAHWTSNLADTVDFDTVSFKSSNMPIEVGSLYATNARIATSNSYIEGDFEISLSLKLLTANSHIKAKVDLFNDEDAGVTDITMKTSNAPINATLALVSAVSGTHPIRSDVGGKFKVSATTSLSPLNITIPRAPVDSVLMLDAYTSLSPVAITLHETYEGTFNLMTTWNRPDVVVDDTVEDPKGGRRRRSINVEGGMGDVSGTVRWGNVMGRGVVKVGTSWAPVALNL